MEKNFHDTERLFAKGTKALVAGDAPLAIENLQAAVRSSEGRDFRCQYNLVIALIMDGDRYHCLELARNLRAQNPLHYRAYICCGWIYLLQRNDTQAMRHFETAKFLEPQSTTAEFMVQFSRARVMGTTTRSFVDSLQKLSIESESSLFRHRIENQLRCISDKDPHLLVEHELCADAWLLDYYPVREEAKTNLPSSAQSPLRPSVSALQPLSSSKIEIAAAAEKIERARYIVAITGAGFSKASDLKTRKELWQEFNRDDTVSIWRFKENPDILWSVIREFLGPCNQIPNAAHLALTKLPSVRTILTQNVDGLHQMASASLHHRTSCPMDQDIVELHGTLHRTYCVECHQAGPSSYEIIRQERTLPPSCSCGGILRPDVVLFGEALKKQNLDIARQAVSGCDLLLVMGCAMDVSPVSELPHLAVANQVDVIEMKRSQSELAHRTGGLFLQGPVEELLPQILQSQEHTA